MTKYIRLLSLCLLGLIGSLPLLAQVAEDPAQPVEMADAMRSNGKIYVVVAVLVTILVGLLIYVIQTDRKITRLEKESRS